MVHHVYKVIHGHNNSRQISAGKILPREWEYFIVESSVAQTIGKSEIVLATLKKVEL